MTKATKRKPHIAKEERVVIDSFETMKAELDECVALLRHHYPEENNEQLLARAPGLRAGSYARGRWPSDVEIAERKAADEKAAADLNELRRLAAAKAYGAHSPETAPATVTAAANEE